MRIEIECAGCKRMVLKSRTDRGFCPLCCRTKKERSLKVSTEKKRAREICRLCGKLFAPTKEIKTICYPCVLKDIRERMMR